MRAIRDAMIWDIRRAAIVALVLVASPSARSADPRAPVPPAQPLARSEARIREVFADELKSANTPAEKSDVARRLAEHAGSTADPSDRFALLALALDKAIEAGDVAGGSGFIERISREFAVEAPAWKLDAAARLAAKAGLGGSGDVAALYLVISREAMEAGDDDSAMKAVALAVGSARKAQNPDLMARAMRLQQKLKERQAVDRELRPLLEAVAANPSDPAANRDAGKVLCLKAERWADGLPLLAKGDDDLLRQIAAAEMNLGDVPAGWVALADAWWDWSDTQKAPWKIAAKARAASHYERALGSLVGLEQARVEKRLAMASRQIGGSGKAVFLADLPEKSVAGHVMFSKDGQCFGKPFAVGGKAFPKSITALPKAKAFSTVAYAIPPGALRCRGRVGIFTPATAKPGEKPASPLVFQVVIDGDVAWRSPPLQKLGDTVGFDVHLDGGRVLELQTAVGDSDWCSWGTWLDPVLIK